MKPSGKSTPTRRHLIGWTAAVVVDDLAGAAEGS
jgi:hypothetical protein